MNIFCALLELPSRYSEAVADWNQYIKWFADFFWVIYLGKDLQAHTSETLGETDAPQSVHLRSAIAIKTIIGLMIQFDCFALWVPHNWRIESVKTYRGDAEQ